MENVKTNGDVIFYENNHIYVNAKNPDIRYTSVTTLIKDYHELFDKEFWGGYKALENLMGKDFSLVKSYLLDKKKIDFEVSDLVDEEEYKKLKSTIMAEYDRKSFESSAYGTKIHKEKEEMFFRSEKINLQDCGFLLHEGVYDCERNNYDLNRERAVLPEYLIYYSDNNILHIAGQIDLLIKDGNDLYIYDYKTNENGIESKAYFDKKKKQTKKMFFPLNNLEDTKLNHYTMQLSMYAWMLKQINPEFNIKRLCLIHIDHSGTETEIDVPFKEEEVKRVLKSFTKKLKIKALKDL